MKKYEETILTIRSLSNNTKNKPLIIHINPIGLFRMDKNNQNRFEKLNMLLKKVQVNGGNIAIPSYSYSYTKNEIYNVLDTTSTLGGVSEYLRVNNKNKRTADANFSYLLFGDKFSEMHFSMSDYSSFGGESLVNEVFSKNGYLGVIGGVWEHLTEIHYLEKCFDVDYRFDKDFYGISIDSDGNQVQNRMTYFCRDLSLNYSSSLAQFKRDIRAEGLVKTWVISDFNLKIEVIEARELFNFIKKKLSIDLKYLWKR